MPALRLVVVIRNSDLVSSRLSKLGRCRALQQIAVVEDPAGKARRLWRHWARGLDRGSYHCLDAFIEQHQLGYDDDGILCQLVSVIMTDDHCWLDPALCLITAQEARELASELLAAAEHAERIARERKNGR